VLNSAINLCFFSNQPVRGGVEEHMLLLLRGLDRKYFRPHLVCHPELAAKLRPDLPEDVPLEPLYLEHPYHLFAGFRFARILHKYRIQMLHSHLFRASLAASPIARLCRVPVTLETPHVAEMWRKGWLKGNFALDRAVGHAVSRYIAVSEANARYLLGTKRLPPQKVQVIQNGCDLERFLAKRPAPAHLKRSLGFSDGEPVLVVLARLEAQKGHRVLIKAMSVVRAQFPSVRLVCVGAGSLRYELEKQVRMLGLEESIRFVGHQSNTPDWLALADVVVLPSFFEGLPLVAIEALAAGRAVVATAVDGTPEVVIDGRTGLTVHAGDPDALAAAICRMLGSFELRRSLAETGRRWVLDNFSLQRFVDQTQQFYLTTWERCRGEIEPRRSSAFSCASNPASERSSS
jgi:glycosyltransferase involved in cell wall biosynthesis